MDFTLLTLRVCGSAGWSHRPQPRGARIKSTSGAAQISSKVSLKNSPQQISQKFRETLVSRAIGYRFQIPSPQVQKNARHHLRCVRVRSAPSNCCVETSGVPPCFVQRGWRRSACNKCATIISCCGSNANRGNTTSVRDSVSGIAACGDSRARNSCYNVHEACGEECTVEHWHVSVSSSISRSQEL